MSKYYDSTTDFYKESDYDMYSEPTSECGKDHIHVGPFVVEICEHDEGKHVCVYLEKTGKKIAETDVSDHSIEDHMQVIGENMDGIHKACLKDLEEFDKAEEMEKRCWEGYEPTPGKKPYSKGSCQPIKKADKPFHGYNPKKHSKTGGLSDSYRKKVNREEGSNLKRPVTGKVKPGSKAANRRKSFCARMSGVKGPTSKDGKLTPKGAALKRWKCSKSETMDKSGSRMKAGIIAGAMALAPHIAGTGPEIHQALKDANFKSHSKRIAENKMIREGIKPEYDQQMHYDSNGRAVFSQSDEISDSHFNEYLRNRLPKKDTISKSEKLKQFIQKVESKKLEHYSSKEGLQNIDPSYAGSGVDYGTKGRGMEHPVSFYYHAGADPEGVVVARSKKKYTVDIPHDAKIYNLSEDPEGHIQQAIQENNGAFNRDILSRRLKDAGYHGFSTPNHQNPIFRNVVALFHSMPVSREEGVR